MPGCECELSVLKEAHCVHVLTSACSVHADAHESTFSLRAWIIQPGTFFNGYRRDTGTSPSNGLPFQRSRYHDNLFVCDLESLLVEEESREGLTIGVCLFIDGVLTKSQGVFQYKAPIVVATEKLEQRLSKAVKYILGLKAVEQPFSAAVHVETALKLKGWLAYFADINEEEGDGDEWTIVDDFGVPALSKVFDRAVDVELAILEEDKRLQEREESLSNLGALQHAQAQAKFAQEQVELLRMRLAEMETHASETRGRLRAEIAELRAQLEQQKLERADATDYACKRCTFLNPITMDTCAMCNTERGKESPEEEKHSAA